MGARIEGRDRAGPFPRAASSDPGVPYGGTRGAANGTGNGDGVELRTLLSRLGQDASQLAHDEIELARIEIRDIAEAFSSDIREAGQTVVENGARVGIALSLAFLAGLALTAGAVLAIGVLVGAYWAGGLIVGTLLLIAAGLAGASAARDLRDSEALRMQHGRDTLQRDSGVLRDEARETQAFAKREAREFKRNATPHGSSQPRV